MFNKTISKQLTQIIQLCYQINYEETSRAKTGNFPTVFVEFCGHTCQLDARIYDDGWGAGIDPDYSVTIYLWEAPDRRDASAELAKLIERLGVTLKLKERKERKRDNAKM